MHGKLSTTLHDGRGLFAGVPPAIEVVRYHSLVVDRDSIPDELEISALAMDGEVMALRHRWLPIEGVQFHPEPVFTPHGPRILENFLAQANAWTGDVGASAVEMASDTPR
jgi:anthranilate synthase component 2